MKNLALFIFLYSFAVAFLASLLAVSPFFVIKYELSSNLFDFARDSPVLFFSLVFMFCYVFSMMSLITYKAISKKLKKYKGPYFEELGSLEYFVFLNNTLFKEIIRDAGEPYSFFPPFYADLINIKNGSFCILGIIPRYRIEGLKTILAKNFQNLKGDDLQIEIIKYLQIFHPRIYAFSLTVKDAKMIKALVEDKSFGGFIVEAQRVDLRFRFKRIVKSITVDEAIEETLLVPIY